MVFWVGNGCQFNVQGLTYFGVGLVGGWASLYMSPAGGGALMSGMNSIVRQGFGTNGNWDWNNISIEGALFDTAIGGATAGLGSKISGKLSPYISKYTSKLGGKAVQEMTTQGLTSSATGFTLSTGASLLEGDDIETALGKGWSGAKSGWIAGSIGGLGHGLRQAYKAGENPWTGKSYGAKGKQTIVGEGMKRVRVTAEKNPGSIILDDMPEFSGSRDQVTSQMMEYNRKWLLEQMRSGRPIMDIGVDPTRITPSIFYQMEQRMINNYLKLHPNAFKVIKP